LATLYAATLQGAAKSVIKIFWQFSHNSLEFQSEILPANLSLYRVAQNSKPLSRMIIKNLKGNSRLKNIASSEPLCLIKSHILHESDDLCRIYDV